MDANWIVSANAGRARIFSQERLGAPLNEIEDLLNAAARLRTAQTESDGLGQNAITKGRNNGGAISPSSGYQPHQTPARHQTELFARTIAEHLLHAYERGSFDQLVLVCSPEFLGILRKLLAPQLSSHVRMAINKDYTHLSRGELREELLPH